MPENGVEIVGGLAQSWNPDIYKLPPVADWAVQAVPGENGGESPILYSVALADLSVRQTLIAVGDAMVPANNGNMNGEAAKTLDLARLSPQQIEEALEGAEIIRGEKDLPTEVRQPVLDFVKAAKSNERSTSETPMEEPKPKKKSRNEVIREQNERRQKEHRAERRAEIERLAEWQEEHPCQGSNYLVGLLPLLESYEGPKNNIIIKEKEGFYSEIQSALWDVIKNPDRLYAEFGDSDSLTEFFNQDSSPVLVALFNYALDREINAWEKISADSPEQLMGIVPAWFETFKTFSDEYKSSVTFELGEIENSKAKEQGPPLSNAAYITDYGIRFIHNSLMTLAESHPETFAESVHGLLDQAIDTEDEFTARSIFFAIRGVIVSSQMADILIEQAPVARGLDEKTRLKAVDIYMLLDSENGFVVPRQTGGKSGKQTMPPRIAKLYGETWKTAMELGIDPHKPGYGKKIRQTLLPAMVEKIKAGEFPDSLYQKAKQQGLLPEDA